MEVNDLVPIVAILAAAVTLVIVLWRLMRPHIPPPESEADETGAKAWAESPELSHDEAEYLDSSHIINPPSGARSDPPR